MNEPKTICVKCEYHEVKENFNQHMWYNQICMAPEVERTPDIDCVSGIQGYSEKNSLGMSYVTSEKHPNCRDINHGNCPHFKKKILGF